MDDSYVINISKLKNLKELFHTEKKHFQNDSYDIFKESYLNSCSDPIVEEMYNNINEIYSKINKSYNNIYNWWDDYLENIIGLENSLSSFGKNGNITESSLRNYVINQLPELKDFKLSDKKINFSVTKKYNNSFINNKVSEIGSSVAGISTSFLFNKDEYLNVNATICQPEKSIVEENSWWDDTKLWFKDTALPWITNATDSLTGMYESVQATACTAVLSVGEGVLQFGEAIVDTGAEVLTAGASIFTGVIDLFKYGYSKVSGNEYESLTNQMWDGTKAFVAKDHVTSAFDYFYSETAPGRWLAEESYFFDEVRSIANSVGYLAGATLVSAVTGIPPFAVAGIAGVGRGSAEAWKNGATTLEGLGAGLATGLWEGAQFKAGELINGLKLFKGPKNFTKVLNAFTRATVDGLDGGVEGFIQPLIKSIYADGFYDENGEFVQFSGNDNFIERYNELWDDNGGWNYVMTETISGSAFSLFSESVDLGKYFIGNKKYKVIDEMPDFSDFDINKAMDESNKLVELFKTDDYKEWNDNANKGYAQVLRKDFENAEIRYKELSDQMNNYIKFQNQLEVIDVNKIPKDKLHELIKKSDVIGLKQLVEAANDKKLNIILKDVYDTNFFDFKKLLSYMDSQKLDFTLRNGYIPQIPSKLEVNSTRKISTAELLDVFRDDNKLAGLESLYRKGFSENTDLPDLSGINQDQLGMVLFDLNEAMMSSGCDFGISRNNFDKLRSMIEEYCPATYRIKDWSTPKLLNSYKIEDILSGMGNIPGLNGAIMIRNNRGYPISELFSIITDDKKWNEFIKSINEKGTYNIYDASVYGLLFCKLKTIMDSKGYDFQFTPEQKKRINTIFNNEQILGFRKSNYSDNAFFRQHSLDTKFGVDQGQLENLFVYQLNGINYSFRQAKNLIERCKANHDVLPKFSKKAFSNEYFDLKDKVKARGFDSKQASIIIESLDTTGACSYADKVNMIFSQFRDNPDEFERIFGFPMYINKSGINVFNGNELLLDMFIYSNDVRNGGKLISFDNGKAKLLLNDDGTLFNPNNFALLDTKKQAYMSTSKSGSTKHFKKYIESKGLVLDERMFKINAEKNIIKINEWTDILNKINESRQEGYSLELNIFSNGNEINMYSTNNKLYHDVSTKNWHEGSGHAVFVTDVLEKGVLVSSWGQEYFIPFCDLALGGTFSLYAEKLF